MKYLKLYFILSLSLWLSCNDTIEQKAKPLESKKIVAIFSHPDDETTISPVLAKYANNHEVHVIIATDGRFGVTDHTNIPEGDSLVQIREKEAACSCAALGIEAPIFLGLKDGLGSQDGMSAFFSQLGALENRLRSTLDSLSPDIIITFGPGGDSGHPDHRLVGDVTTQVYLEDAHLGDTKLFYFEWTKEQSNKLEGWNLKHIHQNNTNVHISFSEEDEKKSFESIACYKTQYTQKTMDEWIQTEKDDKINMLHFRELKLSITSHDELTD